MAIYSTTRVHNTPTASATVTSMKPLSDCLQAMVTAGALAQTSDTGQVAWGSVLGTQTSTYNYEIFKLNDSMVTSFPIFMKFGYQSQVTGTPPRFSIQIGTGSDGAGNLTGNVSNLIYFMNIQPLTTADTNAQTIWASSGSGYLNVWGGFSQTPLTSSYGGYGLSIERLRDSSGAITGDGIHLFGSFSNTGASNTFYSSGTSAGQGVSFTTVAGTSVMSSSNAAIRANFPSLFNQFNSVSPPVMNRGGQIWFNPLFDGSNFLASSIQPFAGKLYSPGIACMVADTNFAALTNYSMSIYSTSHNYLTANNNLFVPTGASNISYPPNVSWGAVPQPTYAIPAFLYE